jgi:hypothetical protein
VSAPECVVNPVARRACAPLESRNTGSR